MATVPKSIKAVVNFSKALPEEVLATGSNVLRSLTGNVKFPDTPVDLGVFKAALDAYSNAIGEAKDGGRRAILARNKQGEDIIRMLRSLASYVEFYCKDDMDTFLSSGFQPRSYSRTATQPLDTPAIASVEQGPSGTFMIVIKGVRKAKTYDIRFGALGSGGAPPASWTIQTVPHAKLPAAIKGLIPATTYAIQVRAYGSLGHTEWSHAATRMAI